MTTQSKTYVTTTTFEALAARINESKKITVTTHRKPDGDAIGSVVALYRALHSIGKDVEVLIIGPLEHGLAIVAGDTPIRMVETKGYRLKILILSLLSIPVHGRNWRRSNLGFGNALRASSGLTTTRTVMMSLQIE